MEPSELFGGWGDWGVKMPFRFKETPLMACGDVTVWAAAAV